MPRVAPKTAKVSIGVWRLELGGGVAGLLGGRGRGGGEGCEGWDDGDVVMGGLGF